MAQEVAQQTFCTLAQKADAIRNPALTVAWLHRTSHQLALLHLRTEKRRQLREHAAAMDLATSDSNLRWDELEPLLDGALETLEEPDRTAILLRYFEGCSMADVGSALGVSEGAARMRVGRALERLRTRFVQEGIVLTAAALALAFEQNAHSAAPDSLIASVLSATSPGSPLIEPSSPEKASWQRVLNPWLLIPSLLLVGLIGMATQFNYSAPASGPGLSPTAQTTTSTAAAKISELPNHGQLEVSVIDQSTGFPLADVEIVSSDRVNWVDLEHTQTDPAGRCRLTKPKDATDFHFAITARREGYASQRVSWSRHQRDRISDLPDQFEIHLAPGTRVGGVVTDPAGDPLPGVTIELHDDSNWSQPTGRSRPLLEDHGRETTITDTDGRWSFRGMPPEWSRVAFTFRSPRYQEARFVTQEADRNYTGIRRLPTDALVAGQAHVILFPGSPLAGRVLDFQGNPVSGAVVTQDRRWNDASRQTKSDPNGDFEILNLGPGEHTLTAQAPGLAPASIALNLPREEPVSIRLEPGRLIRGQIVDQGGNPVPGATLQYDDEVPPGDPYRLRLQSDDNGRFEWDQAPTGAIPIRLSKPGHLTQRRTIEVDDLPLALLLPRATNTPSGTLTGRVVDDQTGQPIEQFEVTFNGLDPGVAMTAPQGAFSLSLDGTDRQIEVKADGYRSVSQPLSFTNSPEVTLEFRLVPGGLHGFIFEPNGQPAQRAEVALYSPHEFATLADRRFLNRDHSHVVLTDHDGLFRRELPGEPQLSEALLVVVHASGYAEHEAAQFTPGSALRLKPWGRIVGRIERRTDLPEACKVYLLHRGWTPWLGLMGESDVFSTQPNADGEFVFEGVPPGLWSLGLLPTGTGSIGKVVTLDVRPGESTTAVIPAEGVNVRGQLTVPDLPSGFEFTHSSASVRRIQSTAVDLPSIHRKDVPAEAFQEMVNRRNQERLAHWKSAEGIQAWMEDRIYPVELGANGSFTVRRLPPGEYELSVMLRTDPIGWAYPIPGGTRFLKCSQPLVIPAAPEGMPEEAAFDLGLVRLEP